MGFDITEVNALKPGTVNLEPPSLSDIKNFSGLHATNTIDIKLSIRHRRAIMSYYVIQINRCQFYSN
jgi:hypothetical protein